METVYIQITTDGELNVGKADLDGQPLLNELVGCDLGCLEMLRVGPHDVMWIDEIGKYKEKQPNKLATALMGEVFARIDVIVGNAVVTGTQPPHLGDVSPLVWKKLAALCDGLLPWPDVMAMVGGVGKVQTGKVSK